MSSRPPRARVSVGRASTGSRSRPRVSGVAGVAASYAPRRSSRRSSSPSLSSALLGYYYTVFSERIDRLLRGEVFTRSAGIYAAPKQLKVGDGLSAEDLVARLRRAGYVERAQQADTARGRLQRRGHGVEIEPSKDSHDRRPGAVPARCACSSAEGRQNGRGHCSDLDANGREDTERVA